MTIVKSAAAVLMSGWLIGAPVAAGAATPTNNIAEHYQGSQLVDQLASAKQLDWQYALDPSVAAVTRSDCLDQMNKSARVTELISYGFEVPQQELADALWTPPKAISPEARDHLIRQLQEARLEDDHKEQEMFKNSEWSAGDGGGAPAETAAFDQQVQLVDSVIKDLEIGEGVHWSAIKEALYVPSPPD
jgi:phosphoenolpyruvate carboxylase